MAAGGLATTATVLIHICAHLGSGTTAHLGSGTTAAPSLRAALLRHHEVLSVLLGLAINLLAGRQEHQWRLAELELPRPQAAAAAGQQGSHLPSLAPQQQGQAAVALLPVLCDILNELEAAGGPSSSGSDQGAAAAAAAGHQKQQAGSSAAGTGAGSSSSALSSPPAPAAGQQQQQALKTFSRGSAGDAAAAAAGGAELTEAELVHAEGSGVASILEMYAAMLLGFMLQGNTGLRPAAAARLRGASLAPVVAVIHSSLAFYLQAGAITDVSKEVLVRLLRDLGQGQ
jgi:hypothetical protein